MCDAYCSAKTLSFFDILSDKLVLLAESINDQFEYLKKNIYVPAEGAVLASIIMKPPPIGVKYEFIEYIKRYGPPTDGIFDQGLLQGLRAELGIVTI
jgi:hypothetical protein